MENTNNQYFEDLERLKKILIKSSLVTLCDISDGIAEFLDEMGEEIRNEVIANALVDIHGSGIMNIKKIRDELCDIKQIDSATRWQNNDECRRIIKNIGISEDFLPKPSVSRSPIEVSSPNTRLHDYQDYIKRKVSQFILSNNSQNKLMVQMPTGSGKTWTMMESIYDFIRVSSELPIGVIWMAHTDELCEQAVESFQRGWLSKGTFNVNIIRLWGGNIKKINITSLDESFFAVMSLQTAYSMIRTNSNKIFKLVSGIKNKSEILVVDEAHMSLARTYNLSIDMLAKPTTKVIGLTATPGRHGLNQESIETKELAHYFEGRIFDINDYCKHQDNLSPLKYLQNKGILSTINKLILKTNFQLELSAREKSIVMETLELPESALKRVGKDINRNRTIVAQIKKLSEKYKKILVFASSKENSDNLASILTLLGHKAKSITGETPMSDRRRSVKNFKEGDIQILLNYNVFTTGFDEPKIDCVVIARPTTSVVLYSQMLGRGLRGPLNGGTEECTIVDVIDNIENQPDINFAHRYFENAWHN